MVGGRESRRGEVRRRKKTVETTNERKEGRRKGTRVEGMWSTRRVRASLSKDR